jgi:hypothetical protein
MLIKSVHLGTGIHPQNIAGRPIFPPQPLNAFAHLQREAGQAPFAIDQRETHQDRLAGENAARQLPADLQIFEGEIREGATDENKAEQHPQQQVQGIVAGVESSNTYQQGDPDKPPPNTGEAEAAQKTNLAP